MIREWDRNDIFEKFISSSHPNLHIIVSCLFASFYVGAPPARLTRIEKSLLQAYFRSVNYCQYNFVEH
ncbi:hypothetical protein CXY98_15060 [Staphylococcus aureus]|nr:hypothetical protein CXY97_13985 [Staphylococcus aureus]PKR06639.1 hypothetical protein CXY98_15060 [Staphylococcus aureus]